MKTTTKLNIMGYILFGGAWASWFFLSGEPRLTVFFSLNSGAMLAFAISLVWPWAQPLFQAAQKGPPEDDGEPRSE